MRAPLLRSSALLATAFIAAPACRTREAPTLPAQFRQLLAADPMPLLEGVDLGPGAARKITVGRTVRNGVVAPAPSRFEVRTRVPAGAQLTLGFAVLKPRGTQSHPGLHFDVELVDARGLRRTLVSQFLEPARVGQEDAWTHRLLDLRELAGQEVRLELSVRLPQHARHAKDACCGAWAHPRYVMLPQRRGPNLLLISIDTLRADHLGCYGYPRPTSPAIDAWAAGATRFAHAVSQAPWTTPSHMSLLTGLYPTTHQANQSAQRIVSLLESGRTIQALSPGLSTLAEVLRARGYQTGAFTGGATVAGQLGFAKGFEVYHETTPQLDADAESRIRQWLGLHREWPFFLFLHTFQVHAPYLQDAFMDAIPPRRRARVREYLDTFPHEPDTAGRHLRKYGLFEREVTVPLYDGGIRFTDAAVGRLLASLKQMGLYDRTIVVLTSDHGEEFGEHDPAKVYNAHGHSLYEELTHVPLVLSFPGEVPSGRVVGEPVQLVDVMPTVLELMGVPLPDPVQGASLVPLLRGGAGPAPPAFSEAVTGPWEMKALRTARYKYILTGSTPTGQAFHAEAATAEELYDLVADPGERHDLSRREAATTAALRAELQRVLDGAEARRRGAPSQVVPDADLKERLRALGYVE